MADTADAEAWPHKNSADIRKARDRLESLSRQLSDAQRERDELRAAFRKKVLAMKTRSWGALYYVQRAEVLAVIEHTEGGKP